MEISFFDLFNFLTKLRDIRQKSSDQGLQSSFILWIQINLHFTVISLKLKLP